MSELHKNINKMPDDDLMYLIHIDTIISAFEIMKEMGGDLSHIQSCKEELKSLNAGKSEWEQPLQELQRNLEGLENEQKASHREEKRIRQQLIDDEFTFQAYAGVPKPKRQKKQSVIEPLEEEIEAPGGIKRRSRREVVDTHTASLDSNALKQEVFDTKQLGHVKEHKKGGVETELSKYVEGLIEEIAGKRLSQLILEAKVPRTEETFEFWRKREENAGKTKSIYSTLRRSIIKEITKTSYDSIKKAYKEKKARKEEKGYESETPTIEYARGPRKGGKPTEFSEYLEGLIEEIAGKRLSQLILEAKVPGTEETFEFWRKREENAENTSSVHRALKRSIINKITKTSYDSIKDEYEKKKARKEEKGYESETPAIEYARKRKEKSLEKSRKDPIDAKIVPGTE